MDIYQHFRKEEQPYIDRVLSWKELVERSYQPVLTDFLDPREQQIINLLVGGDDNDLKLNLFGGGNFSERKRAIIVPEYEEVVESDFGIIILQTNYHEKFVSLSHGDVMGSFLSLGLERKKLGDIIVKDGLVQILLTDDISTYVVANLTSIKNTNVNFVSKSIKELVEKELYWISEDHLVSSMRLDTIIKSIYAISRQTAAESISKKLVKVNYRVVDDRSFTVQANDLISFKGKGRSKVEGINGKTKKEKLKITTSKLK
ncbi:RNA-binding protein [Virgibacillus sp. DJP39]|uniref:YlmH family RNA-binding protein n=1 Tax=Virgibacillus sp. DJP39 TaxID=3409790 RepID=UPI003BB5DA89